MGFVQFVIWLYTHDFAAFHRLFVAGALEQAYRFWLLLH